MAEHSTTHQRRLMLLNPVYCNLCNKKVPPEERWTHVKYHNLTWVEVVAYGIFSYKFKELSIEFSSDGCCPECSGEPSDAYFHKIYLTKTTFRELLKCKNCGVLFFCHFVDTFDSSDDIVSIGKFMGGNTTSVVPFDITQLRKSLENDRRRHIQELKADLSLKPPEKVKAVGNKKCNSCDYSQFSRGSYICTLVDNYSQEIVVDGEKASCTAWKEKTEEHRQRDVKAIALYFSDKWEQDNRTGKHLPMVTSNIP